RPVARSLARSTPRTALRLLSSWRRFLFDLVMVASLHRLRCHPEPTPHGSPALRLLWLPLEGLVVELCGPRQPSSLASSWKARSAPEVHHDTSACPAGRRRHALPLLRGAHDAPRSRKPVVNSRHLGDGRHPRGAAALHAQASPTEGNMRSVKGL